MAMWQAGTYDCETIAVWMDVLSAWPKLSA